MHTIPRSRASANPAPDAPADADVPGTTPTFTPSDVDAAEACSMYAAFADRADDLFDLVDPEEVAEFRRELPARVHEALVRSRAMGLLGPAEADHPDVALNLLDSKGVSDGVRQSLDQGLGIRPNLLPSWGLQRA
jgi:hypothetical protein